MINGIVEGYVRRLGFDEVTMGWSGDNYADLAARIELIDEFVAIMGPMNFAENKIYRAMAARLVGFKISRGEVGLGK